MKKKFVSLAVIMAMLASLFPVIGIAEEDVAAETVSANNIQVAEGEKHSVVLKSDGTVWTVEDSKSKQVIGLIDICAVSAGTYHSLALKNDGTVWAWGGK